MPGRGRSDWLADPNDYVFPTYLTVLTALIARSGAETVGWVGTSMGGLLGIVMAAQPQTPVARLVVNDVGPTIEPAALERIRGYFGLDPTFATYDEIAQYVRTVSAPFGPLTDAQWERLTRSNVRAARRRPLGTGLRPGHRGAVSRGGGAARPVAAVGCDPLPDARSARQANPTCCRPRPPRRWPRAARDRASSSSRASATRRCCCPTDQIDAGRPLPARIGAPRRHRRLSRWPGFCFLWPGLRAQSGAIPYNRRGQPSLDRHAAHRQPAARRSAAGQPSRKSGPAKVFPWLDELLTTRPGRGGARHRRLARGDQPGRDERFEAPRARRAVLGDGGHAVAAAREAVLEGLASAVRRGAGGGEGRAGPRARALGRLQAPAAARVGKADPARRATGCWSRCCTAACSASRAC